MKLRPTASAAKLTVAAGFAMGPKKTEATKKASGGKKKLSGFMLFSKDNRQKVKDENPGIPLAHDPVAINFDRHLA